MDTHVWTDDLREFYAGNYSYASVVTSAMDETFSQVERGRKSVFVGIYEGHGGNASLAASWVNGHLFDAIIDDVRDKRFFSEAILKHAMEAIEHDFMGLVREKMRLRPEYMISGSCCLTGMLFRDKLYVSNMGDSRIVIGSRYRGELIADLVGEVHNINNEEARTKFLKEHEGEEGAVTSESNPFKYKIKGRTEVTIAIGDAYLKGSEFKIPRERGIISLYRITGSIDKPYVGSVPFAKCVPLLSSDDFIIFASSSLWDQLTMLEAVNIVSETRFRSDAARNLIEHAVRNVARKRGTTYEALMELGPEARRAYHGDITAVVVFLEHPLLGKTLPECHILSDKPFKYGKTRSRFREIADLM